MNDIAATWFFEQGDYLASTGHYINNLDHDGINRCMARIFHAKESQAKENENSLSVELHYNFTAQYIMRLPDSFIAANPYLLVLCALTAYHEGNVAEHLRYADLLRRMQPEISKKYPNLALTSLFVGGIDPRMTLRGHIRALAAAQSPVSGAALPRSMTGTATITQNLPLYHRSMRDFSEYHELNEEDLTLFRETLGRFMGASDTLYEQCLMAGIHYEKGDLLKALHHALNARYDKNADASSEAFFSSAAILAQTLYAMGAATDAKRVLEQAEARLNERARCLIPNLKAIQAEHAVRAGDAGAAQEWLAVYAARSWHLPFYQMPRHFTTLRSYIAMEYFASAIRFGGLLHELAAAYKRPLDQIESGILLAVAMRVSGQAENALKMLEEALELACPYGFTQFFLNEGKGILPMLLSLREKTAGTPDLNQFVEKLCVDISGYDQAELKNETPPRLSAMRRKMLGYLEKGMSSGEIADAAGIAQGTAKRHMLLLYKQLGVHSAEEAVAKAKIMGLK